MRQSTIFAALSALTLAVAQNFTVDPAKVEPSIRSDWCKSEFNTCDTLCARSPTANSCDPTTLKFECTCTNGSAPGLEYYSQSLPSLICQKAFEICNADNAGEPQKQSDCKKNIQAKCGTLDASKAEVGGEVTSSSAAVPSATGASTAASTPTSTSSTAAAATKAAYIGNGVAMVAAGVFAALL
ncbi:hypothetical protein B0T25DRAFT_341687 [Lasiosphaeria hispida]|uniref:DUF7707 domain-containing protein n=1 Tax=Lasiosphaeria hispida TaxID=260671 RepID=A0AAJ0M8A6_9PEZI|nr:hypothetical protein B0T25DRAFT_341687 [Lasiosphaeria hispida]